MSPDAKPTDFSAARIHETVQQILTAGVLPAIVQAGIRCSGRWQRPSTGS